MAAQYWVGDFFIDLSRNQITQKTQSQTIPPKALAVLTYLAKNANQVVSHDELLSEVWPDTVVTPNTLQRSITQLRKALGEGSQSYIKTHPKQGYSLEVEVRWQDKTDPHASLKETAIIEANAVLADSVSQNSVAAVPELSQTAFKPSFVLVGLIILAGFLAIVGYQILNSKQASSLTFDRLRSLTATDDKEFDATYTPDGNYIVFHRYLDKQCVNNIWAKNINTQQETQLTKDWGAYGRHSFSKDGKELIFLATGPCNQPTTQRNCYDLVSLDFEKALESPQQPNVILQCKSSLVRKPLWVSDDKIALLQRSSKRWKLISYSINDNKSSDLYQLKDGNLVDYAYSAKRDIIAVVSINSKDQHYIEILKPDGSLLSSHPIERLSEIPKFRLIQPNFAPSHDQLIFSTGKQLFTLSFDGKISKISSPFADVMMQPEFHPDGKKLLMLKGPYDSDIVKIELNELAESSDLASAEPTKSMQAQTDKARVYNSLVRTNVGEDHAIFQPGGESIAFWSERSGEAQIWITDETGTRQLTRFPIDTYIRGFDWAADGKSLLVNANNMLTQVYLDKEQQSFPIEYAVIRLYQWDSKNNSALLQLRIKGVATFVEYNLNSSDYRVITDNFVLWAQKSGDGRLIYKDHLDQFWRPGPVEDQKIHALDKVGNKSKSFIINDNVIYSINDENKIWSYNIDTDLLSILADVGKSVDYLTDANQTHLLMTIQVAAKKEVVELSVSD